MWHRMSREARRVTIAFSASIVGIGLLAGSAAQAALLPLVPGATINFTATPAPAALPTGPMIASEPFNLVDLGGNPLTGTLTSEVFDDTPTSNMLDFVYILSNTGGAGSDSFNGLSLLPFKVPSMTFSTNVGYDNSGAEDIDPTSAGRSNDATTVTWTFASVSPGSTTDYLIIQTNATQYNANGNAQVVDGGIAGANADVPYLMPVLPEPASIGLVLLGGGMLLGRRRRRA